MKHRTLFWSIMLLSLLLSRESFALQGLQDDMLEVHVKGVTMDPYGNTPIVILEDAERHQAFPIWIGLSEAQAISRALDGTPALRPMTHVLLQNILRRLQVEVARITIHDLRRNTFYASIFLRQGLKTMTIDARPSDAIALALGVEAPIFVAKKVLGSVRTVTLSVTGRAPREAKKFGMHLQAIDGMLAGAFHLSDTKGVLVAFVEAGSQAEHHGIRRGDVITDVDGRQVNTLQDLVDIFKAKKIGQDLVLQVTREQQAQTIRMFLVSLE